ncbi:MAG: cytochrome C oxidase subunit IV family protein [Planctomycetota bacterium]
MADNAHDHDHEHGIGHPAPVKLLLGVFFALIVLTILTVVTAGQFPKPFGLWIAMAFATAKAALVMLFFMHMFWDKPFNILAFMSSLLFVALFIGMTLMDSSHYKVDQDSFPRGEDPVPVTTTDSGG